MGEQSNPSKLRTAIVSGIHPSEWIEIDREYLQEIAGFEFDDDKYAMLMEALFEFRLTQQWGPTPPTAVVLERLEKLANNLDKAESLLRIRPGETPGSELASRRFRRSATNVNRYIWELLESVGATTPDSITLEHISKAIQHAREIADCQRPRGNSTSGRQEVPGLVELVSKLIEIRESAGVRGSVSYWCHDDDSYRGFLHDFLPQILRTNDLIDHLETFHGCNPPPKPVTVSAIDLAEVETSREARLSGWTIRNYYWQALSRR